MLTASRLRKIQRAVPRDSSRLPMLFEALGDPGRFALFCLLAQNKDLCVTDIAAVMKITVSAASQQLRILEMIGIARKRREGNMICYTLERGDPAIKSLIKLTTSSQRGGD